MLFMCLNFFVYENLCVDTVNFTVPMDIYIFVIPHRFFNMLPNTTTVFVVAFVIY